MTLAAASRLGPYEVLAPLGAGGMGEVYRALDTRLGREVAIKVLPASFSQDSGRLRRFEQEARAAGLLNHPNIVAVYDVGTHEGSPYVVTELLEGETLRSCLGGDRLSPRKAIGHARQIAQGLAAAHEKGIVHRDLKPENVFVTRDGRVKILDFGLAKLTRAERGEAPGEAASTETAVTEPGVVLGTVGYMSPEQVRGWPADARSDIFALGAILYEMLSGRRAFQGASPADTTSAILKEDPPALSEASRDIPPGLEGVVRHCLEKNPEERFQSARDLAFGLDTLSGLSGATAAAADRVPRRAALSVPSLVAAVLAISAVALPVGVLVGRRLTQVNPPSFDRVTFRRGVVLSARFGPDGRTILYSASWDGKPPALYIKRPENPDAVPLALPAADLLAVSPSGELAIQLNPRWSGFYQYRGTLARADLSGGAPREVEEDVDQVDWGPDGQLAATRRIGGKGRLEFPLGRVLYETTGSIGSLRFSPRGDLIAFVDHRFPENPSGSIAVIDLAGKKRLLSKEWVNVVGLAWATPDEIWFTAVGPPHGTASPGDRSLYGVTLSGKLRLILRLGGGLILQDVAASGRVLLAQQKAGIRIKALAPNAPRERDLSWLQASLLRSLSGDGRTIAFWAEELAAAGSHYGVYIRKTDGSPPVRLGEGLGARLSPDGKWVASVRRLDGPIVLLPTGPGEPKEVSTAGLITGYSGAWLPDSKHIVFAAREQERGLSRLYVQSVDGGQRSAFSPEGVGSEPGEVLGIVASPDGELVAALSPDRKIALYPVDGGAPRPVPGAVEGELPLQWSADGRSLYVSRPKELFSPAPVFLLDIQTGRRTLWKELMPEDSAGLVFVAYVCVTPDGRAYAYDYWSVLSDLYVAEGLK
jgi:hypothetical protein